LSVDLQSFTGNCNHSNIVLNWATSAETNADYFSIEESPDGTDWKVIGTVKSVGNSSITQNYSFTAQAINSASTYFRLKQTDLSGNSAYFKIIQVANCISNETALNIYPNPCNGTSLTGKIGLQSNEIYSVDIFDNLGKMVEHFSSVQEQFSLNFSHTLPTGVYYARFSSPGSSMGACFLVRH
jgi:Secretion system C-terminal sorting domain